MAQIEVIVRGPQGCGKTTVIAILNEALETAKAERQMRFARGEHEQPPTFVFRERQSK